MFRQPVSIAAREASATSTKLLGLELIRCISAVAVLFWHYQHFWFVGQTAQEFAAAQQPLYSVFKLFYQHGSFGVQVFWCISGYLFFWKYRDAVADARLRPQAFSCCGSRGYTHCTS